MKKRILTLGCIAALFAFSSEVRAAAVIAPIFSATATANATATIASPITIKNTSDLAFGTIVASESAGTVIIDPRGNRTGTGGVELITINATPFGAASFDVTGEKSATYAVTLPENDKVMISNGKDQMAINRFTASSPTGTLREGRDTFTVGGSLEVNANQPSGLYRGTFSVTAAYN